MMFRRLLALSGALLWLSGEGLAQTYPVPRTQFPFDVSRIDNSFDQKINIVENRIYYFDLQFAFADQAEKDRISTLIGDGARYPNGRFGNPGTFIPIWLRITAGDANPYLVFQGVLGTEGRSSLGDGYFNRTIAWIRLPPGIYRIQALTIRDIPSVSGTRTLLEIGYDPRASPIR